MKYRRKPTLCLFASFIIAGMAINSLASCPIMTGGPPCQEYWQADAVFIGVVTRVVRVPNQTQLAIGPFVQSTVYLNVEEAFKGVEGSAVVFDLDYCGYFFKENEHYLVYARRNGNTNKLEVRAGNSRTRPIADATEDLQYIRSLPSGEPGVRILGRVVHYKHNIKASLYDGDPLANIKVTLEGNNQRQETSTNSEGQYEFKNLSAGDYKVRAEFPDPFGVDEQTVKSPARGCVQVNMTAKSKGQITGRVLDSEGKPLVYVPVSIVSADVGEEQILVANKEKAEWAFALTNEDGRYEFSFLAPGRYLLVINRAEFERSRGSEAARLLPRLFYPGVNDVLGATVIVIGKERTKEEYNFNLPAAPD